MPTARPTVILALSLILAGSLAIPAHAAVIERFDGDPLAGGTTNPFVAEGEVAGHFAFLPDTPSHFPGDREGTLRVLYDTTLPAGRIATPIGSVLSLDDDFSFGAILTIRSEGFEASPDGFDQISFGLWNSRTTGLNRTGFPSDSYDLVEFDYFANVTLFGGPFLSPSVAGGNVGDNAFFNFAFQSAELSLPLDTPLLCHFQYAAASRALTLTVFRSGRGIFFQKIAGASVTVPLGTIRPTFLVDALGIAAYTEGFPSLRAVVDYDLIYTGSVPSPFRIDTRRAALRLAHHPGGSRLRGGDR